MKSNEWDAYNEWDMRMTQKIRMIDEEIRIIDERTRIRQEWKKREIECEKEYTRTVRLENVLSAILSLIVICIIMQKEHSCNMLFFLYESVDIPELVRVYRCSEAVCTIIIYYMIFNVIKYIMMLTCLANKILKTDTIVSEFYPLVTVCIGWSWVSLWVAYVFVILLATCISLTWKLFLALWLLFGVVFWGIIFPCKDHML